MGLGAGTYSPFTASFRDKGGEVGNFGVHGILITEDDWAVDVGLGVAFLTALNAATLGVTVKWAYGGIETIVNPSGKAASVSAQRENKLLIRYHDAVNLKVLTASIPTIDLPNLVPLTEANDFMSLASPAFMVALVSAWQAFVVNPETNNLTVIDSAEFVGRNR